MKTRVSIVIPTSNRPDLLARCLGAVLAQRYEPQAFEVVVVDDGHSEEALNVVEALAPCGGSPGVRYVRTDKNARGELAARNRGWRVASGAIVAFIEQESFPDAEWLARNEQLLRAHADEHDATPIAAASPGSDLFVWRETLERQGGFDEQRKVVSTDTERRGAALRGAGAA